MATYSEHEQRILDQKSGEEMDRHKATSPYLNRRLRSEAEVRLDDFRAYLSDFFLQFATAVREEEEAAEAWERKSVERMNFDGRRS